jgi:hypothetical protein
MTPDQEKSVAEEEVGVDDGTRTRSVRSHSPVLYL